MEHMSLEQKETQVKSYFQNVIMGYLACDIHTLLNSELDAKREGGCTAPLAMTVFSAMNQLGYLTSRKNTDEIVKEARTEECIKEFCNDWMKRVDPENYRKSTIQEIMVSFFRHGLAHQFISIALSGITRDPKHGALLSVYTNHDGSKSYVLQAKLLAQDFIKALDLLDKKIHTAKENDPDFLLRFYQRLYEQKQKHLNNNQSLFQKADRNFPTMANKLVSYTTKTSTPIISGEVSITKDGSLDFSV